jgi:nucleoside-diphosphate-sugar epimerase
MRILIIGGTRFIGLEVVRQLHCSGHQVGVFHRGRTLAELPPGVQCVLGDRKQLGDYSGELRHFSPDIVLDMIAITQQDAVSFMEAFRGIAQRVVVISSQDVYRAYGLMVGIESGPVQSIPLTEDAPLRQVLYPYRGNTQRAEDDPRRYLDDYDKILVEQTVLGDLNLPGTVLRLPMVYGPGDYQHRLYPYLKRMDDRRPAIFLDKGLAQWRWTRGYVENVAAAIVLALVDTNAAGQIYNVGEAEALPIIEWVRKIGSAAGWNGQVIPVPSDQLPDTLKSGTDTDHHLVTDSGRIRRDLGYREIVPLDAALAQTILWERQHPPENVDPNQFNYKAEEVLWAKYRRHKIT